MRHLRNRITKRDINEEVKRTLRSGTVTTNVVSTETGSLERKRSLRNNRTKPLNKKETQEPTRQLQIDNTDDLASNSTREDAMEYLSRHSLKRNIAEESSSQSPKLWELPHNRYEANQLNPNIEFQYSREITYESRYTQCLQSVKIKYDPEKFLNFKRLMNNEFVVQDNNKHRIPQRYTKIDSEFRDILYKSIYSKKKDYSIDHTKPEKNDRKLFTSTFVRSRASKYINSNVLSSYTFDFKRATKSSPFTKKSLVKAICINNNEIKTLFPSPYPEHINNESIIFICENCLSYCSSRFKYWRHKQKCTSHSTPPGSVVYCDQSIRLFEIDGRENQTYCRNLCLLSMLFLRSKTLFYEVDPFIFYVLYSGNQLVGYFSKEKLNSTGYNLSCILTLPTFRRQGFGNLLMEFSYLLSRREFKVGTPEKPLSDLGLLTYRYYWKCKIAETLLMLRNINSVNDESINISLEELSHITGFTTTDVVFGLEQLDVLFTTTDKTKFIIAIRDWSYIERVNEKWRHKMIWHINMEKLLWKPLIFGPSGGINATNNNINIDLQSNKLAKSSGSINGNNLDTFNGHMAVVVDYMTNDIADTRDMERIALDNINNRISSSTNLPHSNITSNEQWYSCLIKPLAPGTKPKPHSINLAHTRPIKEPISSGNEDKDEIADDEEETSTLENIDNSSSNDEDYNTCDENTNNDDDDDDDENGMDEYDDADDTDI
ncbi:similar to Saccharomyces cerevisiae YBL052C SAS3 Histone acetyltransferase catalytic subunit of NuA3 complex that acetylates histone H3, involved in transcriptional silencing [Maudiozyma saulgeensis]|uniref:Histone acetyltransferase n=1 Tax=Maudiozyma saulgeensis TaxID=1789683 RepID=A0A1X7R5A7_9SACH|nr:similar to Saccharomyces cerevisiae YBL052C SAS3 Histone acetyltransferase catalytic subunit of NuA3 complex that acetylates histone H3, involved in transcriptional silencing [Kazachstania saulgeensis]